jgi:hypothetical protein
VKLHFPEFKFPEFKNYSSSTLLDKKKYKKNHWFDLNLIFKVEFDFVICDQQICKRFVSTTALQWGKSTFEHMIQG